MLVGWLTQTEDTSLSISSEAVPQQAHATGRFGFRWSYNLQIIPQQQDFQYAAYPGTQNVLIQQAKRLGQHSKEEAHPRLPLLLD